MAYLLGIDIGSVNAKLSLVDDGDKILRVDIEKITSSPRAALNSLISRLAQDFNVEEVASAGVTGSGRNVIPGGRNWAESGGPLSTAAGLLHYHPDARTIIQIGGQSSLVMELEDGLRKPWKLASNPLCAAGTGRFMEQQAYRLGISLDELSGLAMKCVSAAPRIAARCSVFAKTDLIHLQQKGVPMESMLYALCESVARMVASIKKGPFREPIYFVGGVASNRAIVKARADVVSSRNGRATSVAIPEHYMYLGAIGAAMLSKGKRPNSITLLEAGAGQRYYQMAALEAASVEEIKADLSVKKTCTGYPGVDVGSTSTKIGRTSVGKE